MAKQLNTLLVCILTVLFVNPALAAEAEPVSADNDNTEASTEENSADLVLNQPQAGETDDINTAQAEGDDDFIPSSQISEELSVSFPVDI